MSYIFFEKSPLKLHYTGGFFSTIKMFLFWMMSCFFVGAVGASFGIFNITKGISALYVAISWQVIFAGWIAGEVKKKLKNEDSVPPDAN